LRAMKLKITDYSENPPLFDAVRRYYTLLRMTFESNIYKIFETPVSQIYRYMNPVAPTPPPSPRNIKAESALIDFECPKCHNAMKIQANLEKHNPLQEGAIPFPSNNMLKCPHCDVENNVSEIRRQLEAQSKQRVVFEEVVN
jgi:hypothetical protein